MRKSKDNSLEIEATAIVGFATLSLSMYELSKALSQASFSTIMYRIWLPLVKSPPSALSWADTTQWFFLFVVFSLCLYLVRLYLSFTIFTKRHDGNTYLGSMPSPFRWIELFLRVFIIFFLVWGVFRGYGEIGRVIGDYLYEIDMVSPRVYSTVGEYSTPVPAGQVLVNLLFYVLGFFVILLLWDVVIVTSVVKKERGMRAAYLLSLSKRFVLNHVIGFASWVVVLIVLTSRTTEGLRENPVLFGTTIALVALLQIAMLIRTTLRQDLVRDFLFILQRQGTDEQTN